MSKETALWWEGVFERLGLPDDLTARFYEQWLSVGGREMYVLDRQTALYDRLDDLDGLNRCLARAFAVADSHEEQLRLAQRLLDVARRDSNLAPCPEGILETL